MDRRIERDLWLSRPKVIAQIPKLEVSTKTTQSRLVDVKLFRYPGKTILYEKNRLSGVDFAL